MRVSTKNCDVCVYPDAEGLFQAAASHIVEIAAAALRIKDKFSLVLSGGTTPKALYELLASDPYRNQMPWAKTLVFFGDERCVAPESEQSNFRMAREALLSRVPVSPENVFRFRGEIEPAEAAAEYEAIVKKTLGENPRFDLILLGMGDDGHTASLFPGSSALRETEKLVAAPFVEKLKSRRLTLTFSAINAAQNVILLVAGEKKAPAVKRVFARETAELPASMINPKNGKCCWFLDKEAAALL